MPVSIEQITPHKDVAAFLMNAHKTALGGGVDPDAFEDLFVSDGGPVEGKRDFEISGELCLNLVEQITPHGQQPYGRHVSDEIYDHLTLEAEKLVDRLIADFEQALPEKTIIIPGKDTDLNGITYKSRVTIDLSVDVVGDFDWYRVRPVEIAEYEDGDKTIYQIEHDPDMFEVEHTVERTIVVLTSEHPRDFINTVIVCAN